MSLNPGKSRLIPEFALSTHSPKKVAGSKPQGSEGWRRGAESIDAAHLWRKTMAGEKQQLDWDKIKRFSMQVSNDIGAAMLGALSYIGDRLGIFRALAQAGAVTSAAFLPTLGTNLSGGAQLHRERALYLVIP
jgi:hypothetical protein